jgi:hypothetical protein
MHHVARLLSSTTSLMAIVALLGGCDDSGSTTPPDAAPDGGGGGGGLWESESLWELSEPIPCPADVPADDALVELLDALALDLTVGIDYSWYLNYGGYIADDPARLPYFHDLQQDLTLVPCTAGTFALRADEGADGDHPLATQLADGAGAIGLQVTAGGAWEEIDPDAPLLGALELLFADLEADLDVPAAADAAAAIPLPVRTAAGRLLLGVRDALRQRNEAVAALVGELPLEYVFERSRYSMITSFKPGLNPNDEEELALLAPDPGTAALLYGGAVRLAQAIDEAGLEELAAAPPGGAYELWIETPVGAISIRGDGDDSYDPTTDERLEGPILLAIDVGGDDIYRIAAGATTAADHGVALHVDLGGDDYYGYVEVPSAYDVDGVLPSDDGGRYSGSATWGPITHSPHPRQGAGILGYGFLVDLGGGRDEYRSLRFSQGFASVGVGALIDDGGDDRYECEAVCQASAVVGLALLHDRDGNDSYRAFQTAQSFAMASSFALLYERRGNDDYELVIDDPFLYAWYSGYPYNLSMGQADGHGWRSMTSGAVQLSGGLALLRDRAGRDTYTASVMSQGNGYWFGFGVLADAGGPDRYDAVAYSQGSTQHFALSAFLEGGGDDVFNRDTQEHYGAPRTALGGAHDLSVSVFVEAAGDDLFYVPDVALGGSKCHGLGLFVDRAGDDRYHASLAGAIGWAQDYDWNVGDCGNSTTMPSYGFFVDLDGADSYDKPDAGALGDDRSWVVDNPGDADALELSGGVDTTGGDCFARAYGMAWSEQQ